MTLWDVNVLVYAFRRDSPLHGAGREELESVLGRKDPFLFCPFIAASFVRLVTNSRIFAEPSEPAEAWRFVDYLESHPAARFTAADQQTYALFRHLSLVGGCSGNSVPDALLAAIALRNGAVLVTASSGLRRFTGVEVRLIG